MTENQNFYKMQFQMFPLEGNKIQTYLNHAENKMKKLIDFLGYKPQAALELGSGMGLDAIGLSKKGVPVDALELVEDLVSFARNLQAKVRSDVHFIQGDFLNFHPDKTYDFIYYLDGFGVSDDQDQVKLLKNISSWLSPRGKCLIEIYKPEYWKKAVGVRMDLSDTVSRVYDYDHQAGAFLDTWTDSGTGYSYTQSLKCYDLEEIRGLVDRAGLMIEGIKAGGAMDYENMVYHESVHLDDCMMYQVVLVKKS